MLVGGLEHEFYFPPIVGMMIPIWLIFFRGVETTNQYDDLMQPEIEFLFFEFITLSLYLIDFVWP